MNIFIDTSPLGNGHSIRGVGRYTRELVAALKELPSPHTILTEMNPSEKPDIVHYPFFDLFFPTLPFFKKAKTIVTIHDVIPLVLSSHYPAGIKGTLAHYYQRLSLQSVRHIITDSQCSKRDISDHIGVSHEKITVVPLAASQEMQVPKKSICDEVRKRYRLPKVYALYVGDINYNKNLPFLIQAVAQVPKLSLVMVGSQMNNTSIPEGKSIHQAITETGIGDRVLLLDNIPSASFDLPAIYANAAMYIQPSLYEGFGLPVIEAMQCRVPVISSCGGSLPEVIGDAGMVFHPHDVDDCVAHIRGILKLSEGQRAALIKKGLQQAAKFSWERTARETLAVYEKVGAQ